ncbi:MAG: class I SAM-dependent methyltransferase [Lysobacterales bacterium]
MKPPVLDPNWPADVLALYRHDLQEMWDRSIAPHIWNQYHNQLELYLSFAGDRPLRVLDVGCAQGTLALLLAERGHQVAAVDIRSQFLDYARSRHSHGDVRFLAANALEDDLTGEFDLIFANQIIEHLVYPAELLQRMRARLAPGGRLVCTTPNGAYLKNTLPSYTGLGDPRAWEHMQFTADGDGHFFAYRKGELTRLFIEAGFEQVATRYFETPMINGHMKLRYLHRHTPAGLWRALDRMVLALPGIERLASHQLLATGLRPADD